MELESKVFSRHTCIVDVKQRHYKSRLNFEGATFGIEATRQILSKKNAT
jgi:hypothetical protein